MATQQLSTEEMARSFGKTANEGFSASAEYMRSIPEDEWMGPTGAAKWTVRDLAGHIVGEAVWFANLVRGITAGEEPMPMQVYEDLKVLPPDEIARRTEQGGHDIQAALDGATAEQLQATADVGFAKMPLAQATYVSVIEASYHNWDLRARREQNATLPTEWALQLATQAADFGSMVANRQAASGEQGTYLIKVGDGVGPMTMWIQDGDVTIKPESSPNPDVTLQLTADQFMRLLAGRFDLSSDEGQRVPIQGDGSQALALNRVFSGIAN